MNREIKFRAWLPCLSKMTHTGTIEDITKWAPLGCTPIWLQYTGLKDRYGNEVYEGDILSRLRHKEEGNWASPLIHSPDYCTIVVFKNGMFVDEYTDKAIYEVIRPNYIGDNTQYEVIGNIYEHEYLLTK